MSEQTSPGRRQALELAGGNIKADEQHAAPDGHPIDQRPQAQQITQADADMKPATERPMPFARK
jgi:hypothetical protein